MTNRAPVLVWASSCITLWAVAARDPITVLFCIAVTAPYSIMLIREAREQ